MMKKLFALLICLALFISPMRLFAASEDDTSYISVSYSPGQQKLIVDGRDNIQKGSPVVIHLVAGSDAQPSQGNPPVVFDMVFATDDGKFHSELVVPTGTANGIYTACVGNDARGEAYTENIIVYLKDSLATRNTLAAVNAAATYAELEAVITSDGADLGIDMQTESYPAVFTKALFGVKTAEGSFTLDEFADAVAFSRGAAILACEKNVVKVMRNYASAFEYTYAEYEALDSRVRAKADDILLSSDMYSGYVSYADAVLTAKAVLTTSYGELKTLITSNASDYGVNLSGKYATLSSNDKSDAFKMIFDQRASLKTVADITSAFNSAVASLPLQGSGDLYQGTSTTDSRGHSGSSTTVGGAVAAQPSVGLPYTDIASSFAKDHIVNLSNLGIVNGYTDGSFKPDNTVTRAEFCKIVCTAFGFNGDSSQSFADVSESDWYYKYTGIMYNLGIIRGDGTNFYPQNPITRQDAAVILSNALKAYNKVLSGDYTFADSAEIADYAKGSVGSLAANGYFKGDGTNFYPYANITRAETAAVIDRIYTSVN